MFAEFAAALGTSSVESSYLQIIAYLDRVESLSHELVRVDAMTTQFALTIAQIKHESILQFAAANESLALAAAKDMYQKDQSEEK